MAQFSLPNTQTGGSSTITANSLAEAENIAQNQGTWNPGAGTYGANSTLGGGGTPTGLTNTGGVDTSGLAAFAAQTSGVTQKQLDQQKAEFDAQLQFAKDQMQQLGIPQLQINQMLANLQQQQFQSGLVLSQQAQQFNQAATQAALTGWYTPPPGVPSVQPWLGGAGTTIGQTTGGSGGGGAGQFDINNLSAYEGQNLVGTGGGLTYHVSGGQLYAVPTGTAASALYGAQAYASGNYPQSYVNVPSAQLGNAAVGSVNDQGQLVRNSNAPAAPGTPVQTEAAREFNANLGQQYLATAAQLQGPQNTFQLSNYLRGAQANPNVPVYLQNLAQGVGQNLFVAPGQNAPTTQSAAGLVGQLGGNQSATPGWDYNQTLGTIQNIMNAGAQKLAPGALENLTPDELQALGSGIGAAGGTLPSFLQQYAQSRVGQNAPVRQLALA